jgi:hypothetical protein
VVENVMAVRVVVEKPLPRAVREEPPPPTHVPFTAKQPPVRLNPTLEVEVAWPWIERPESVVVPKPPPAMEKAAVEVVAVPATVVVER